MTVKLLKAASSQKDAAFSPRPARARLAGADKGWFYERLHGYDNLHIEAGIFLDIADGFRRFVDGDGFGEDLGHVHFL